MFYAKSEFSHYIIDFFMIATPLLAKSYDKYFQRQYAIL